MKKAAKPKDRPIPALSPKSDTAPDLLTYMARLEQQMIHLERKIDVLIVKTNPKPPIQPSTPQNQQPPMRPERTMFKAVCADCGVQCEVPFKPQPGRDIYCKACFGARKAGFKGAPSAPPVSAAPPAVEAKKPAAGPAKKAAKPAKAPKKGKKK